VTLGEALRDGARRLGSATPLLDARILLQAATGLSHAEIIVRDREPLGLAERDLFFRFVARRAGGEPVSQIVRAREFYGRLFKVTPDVLIPRPETEMLVETAIRLLPKGGHLLDAGTGSGCILVSVLAERKDAGGIGMDASEAALRVARSNALRHGVAERGVMVHDRFETFPGGFDLVLSNPPYIAEGAALPREVADHEPALALYAGPDGLDAYRAIAARLPVWLKAEGAAVFEVGTGQGAAVAGIMEAALPGHRAEVALDLAGHDRMVTLAPPPLRLRGRGAGG
jgi:release factor glutamine methyltransferase